MTPGGDKRSVTVTFTMAEAKRLLQRSRVAARHIDREALSHLRLWGGGPGIEAADRATQKLFDGINAAQSARDVGALPQPGDQLIFGGHTYSCVGVDANGVLVHHVSCGSTDRRTKEAWQRLAAQARTIRRGT